MRNFDQTLALLNVLSKELLKLQRGRREISAAVNLNAGDRKEREERILGDIAKKERERVQVLEELVLFPPHHLEYENLLQQFSGDATFEKSVFIMTKYPDGDDLVKDKELQRVIDGVIKAVAACQFQPRLAISKKYHQNLWENVELYLLGCKRGIAIVEDKFKPQLNPNVAMEWGWMRAMKKNVLYLVEKDVKIAPADLSGLIKDRFAWDNPEPDLEKAVFMELVGALPPAAVSN